MFWKIISGLSFVLVIVLGFILFRNSVSISSRKTDVPIDRLMYAIDSFRTVVTAQLELNALLRYRLDELELRQEMAQQKGRYLIIDRHQAKFWVREGNVILREGNCGVGTGQKLIGGRKWNFETPIGKFSVMRKLTNPWWYRPKWFWTEKGFSKPKDFIEYPKGITYDEAIRFYNSLSEKDKLRVKAVPGYLGKYVLQLAEGIYIHYSQQSTGHVSHGCVRVSKEDAEAIFRLLDVGAPVYIY